MLAIFVVYHQYLTPSLKLRQHFKNLNWKKEKKEGREGKKVRGQKPWNVLLRSPAPKCIINWWVQLLISECAPRPYTPPLLSAKSKHGQGTKATVPWNVGPLWCGLWLKDSPLTGWIIFRTAVPSKTLSIQRFFLSPQVSDLHHGLMALPASFGPFPFFSSPSS